MEQQFDFSPENKNEDAQQSVNTTEESGGDPYLGFSEESVYKFYGVTSKAYKERKDIRWAASAGALSLLGVTLVSFLISFSLVFLSKTSIATENFLRIVGDPAFDQVIQIAFSMISFTVPFVIIYKLFGFRISGLVSFKKTEKGIALPLFFFGTAFCFFANVASSYLDQIFSAFGIDYGTGSTELPQGFFGFLLSFLATAAVPALVEEFALRGIVLGSLRKFGDGFAILTSAVLFGFMHGNFEQIPFAMLVGFFLGFCVVKTNSLRVAVAVHFFNNFIAVFFSYFMTSLSDNQQNAIYSLLIIISFAAGIFFLKDKKLGGDFFALETAKTEATEKQKYKWFFLSPAVIVFIGVCLFESFIF